MRPVPWALVKPDRKKGPKLGLSFLPRFLGAETGTLMSAEPGLDFPEMQNQVMVISQLLRWFQLTSVR